MDNDRGSGQATSDKHGIELMKQSLLASMLDDMKAAPKWLNESTSESSCCIFRIPQGHGGIAEVFSPSIVSIGPYHHEKPNLGILQEHKLGYLHTMLDQIQPYGVSLKDLINVVAPREKMIRQCYSESTDSFSGLDLVKMMILDGCFIIQFLRQMAGFIQTDRPSNNLYVSTSVMWDLVRLENQVPYFVLEDLFETTNVPKGISSLGYVVFLFFSRFPDVFPDVTSDTWERPSNLIGVHLLDSFRLSLIPQDQQGNPIPQDQQDDPVDESSSYDMIRSASKLRRLGIGFKPWKASTFLKIEFDKERRTINIPKIVIDDALKCILPNMVALEQCRGQGNGEATANAAFMGYLIHAADDVQLLRDCKVIYTHSMSNEDVARFFGDVCKDVYCTLGNSYLAPHLAMIDESVKHECAHLCSAQLLNALHDNPWSVLSGLAVIVTLVGMIQTVYTMLQYYHPK